MSMDVWVPCKCPGAHDSRVRPSDGDVVTACNHPARALHWFSYPYSQVRWIQTLLAGGRDPLVSGFAVPIFLGIGSAPQGGPHALSTERVQELQHELRTLKVSLFRLPIPGLAIDGVLEDSVERGIDADGNPVVLGEWDGWQVSINRDGLVTVTNAQCGFSSTGRVVESEPDLNALRIDGALIHRGCWRQGPVWLQALLTNLWIVHSRLFDGLLESCEVSLESGQPIRIS